MSKNYRAQKISVSRRQEVVKDALIKAARLRIRFDYLSDLAKYVALEVQGAERESMLLLKKSVGANELSVRTVVIHYQTFLRSGSPYRRYLEDWWVQHSPEFSEKQKHQHEYMVKYADACNEIHALKEKLVEVETQLNGGVNSHLTTASRLAVPASDAYMFVDNLLREFQDFLRIDGSELVTNDSLARTIATREMLSGYQDWKNSLI